MARKLRVQYPGAIYHVMNRGDRREPIFKDDEDRRRFLETLGEVCAKTGWQVHAYCLMPAAASFRSWWKASVKKSSSIKCARVVNTMAGWPFDCSAIRASFVETVSELKVSPAFPWHGRHARHCLPAACRLLSWVLWASVPHASGLWWPSAPRTVRCYDCLRSDFDATLQIKIRSISSSVISSLRRS